MIAFVDGRVGIRYSTTLPRIVAGLDERGGGGLPPLRPAPTVMACERGVADHGMARSTIARGVEEIIEDKEPLETGRIRQPGRTQDETLGGFHPIA